MEKVIINGIEYVPRSEALTDDRLNRCLESLVEIQYFSSESHKHRAVAFDALNALSPELAKLCADDPQEAWNRVHNER